MTDNYDLAADFLRAIKVHLPVTPHVTAQKPMPLNVWEASNKPFVWVLEESKLIDGVLYRVWVDTAYGRIALTHGQPITALSHGKDSAACYSAVALNKDYYGLHKYLWE